MGEITTDDLKRFAELIGWKTVTYSGVYDIITPDGRLSLNGLPNFLAPESLHLVFDGLERWCAKNNCRYEISLVDDPVGCGIAGLHRNVMLIPRDNRWEDFPEACNVLLNAAIVKAILNAAILASSQEGK